MQFQLKREILKISLGPGWPRDLFRPLLPLSLSLSLSFSPFLLAGRWNRPRSRPRPGDFVSRRNANSPRNNDILTGISMGLINTSGYRHSRRRRRRRDTDTQRRRDERKKGEEKGRRREKEKLSSLDSRRYRTLGRVALAKLINLRFSAPINYWHAFVIQTSAIIRSAASLRRRSKKTLQRENSLGVHFPSVRIFPVMIRIFNCFSNQNHLLQKPLRFQFLFFFFFFR